MYLTHNVCLFPEDFLPILIQTHCVIYIVPSNAFCGNVCDHDAAYLITDKQYKGFGDVMSDSGCHK